MKAHKDDVQVWRCEAGHEIPVALPATTVVCGECARANPTRTDVLKDQSKWLMKLYKVRSNAGKWVLA